MQREAPSFVRLAAGLVLLLGLSVTACGGESVSQAGAVEAPTSNSTSSSVPASTSTTTSLATTTTTRVTTTTTVVATTTTTSTTLPSISLAPGDEGEAVETLQTLLTEHGFFRDVVDGVFGQRTAQAATAFHKATDTERSSTWSESDWDRLAEFPGPELPDRPEEPDRIELDLTRQLLYRIVDHEVADIIPVSSGNGELYENASGKLVRARTPRGDFSLYKHYDGWRISYLGGLYRPWYFRGGYAIHGSDSVPAYPASHGCVRVPNWEADYLYENLTLGLPVHVWD